LNERQEGLKVAGTEDLTQRACKCFCLACVGWPWALSPDNESLTGLAVGGEPNERITGETTEVKLPTFEFAAQFQSGYWLQSLEKATKTTRICSGKTLVRTIRRNARQNIWRELV
jgi:hypothetical protein